MKVKMSLVLFCPAAPRRWIIRSFTDLIRTGMVVVGVVVVSVVVVVAIVVAVIVFVVMHSLYSLSIRVNLELRINDFVVRRSQWLWIRPSVRT